MHLFLIWLNYGMTEDLFDVVEDLVEELED